MRLPHTRVSDSAILIAQRIDEHLSHRSSIFVVVASVTDRNGSYYNSITMSKPTIQVNTLQFAIDYTIGVNRLLDEEISRCICRITRACKRVECNFLIHFYVLDQGVYIFI